MGVITCYSVIDCGFTTADYRFGHRNRLRTFSRLHPTRPWTHDLNCANDDYALLYFAMAMMLIENEASWQNCRVERLPKTRLRHFRTPPSS